MDGQGIYFIKRNYSNIISGDFGFDGEDDPAAQQQQQANQLVDQSRDATRRMLSIMQAISQ